MTARQRNNITRLPQPVRYLISELLDDSVTYDAIRSHPEVAKACAERKLTLHGSSFGTYREGVEHQEFLRSRRKYGEEISKIRARAMVVETLEGADSIARAADFELLRRALDKLDHAENLDPKEEASISRIVASYNRNRIAAEKENAKREYAAKEADYQAKIAELTVLIQRQDEKIRKLIEVAGTVDGSDVAAAMDEQYGLT